jgi:hypothetical protein
MWATAASAVTDAQMCQATKLKRAGQYSLCRLKAESKTVKTGNPVDYTKCDLKFSSKWADAETIPMCPTTGDATEVQGRLAIDSTDIARKLSGVRFVDNGDGTVTDTETGLVWEQKTGPITFDSGVFCGVGSGCSDPHHVNNRYAWNAHGTDFTTPDGGVFTSFLFQLNGGSSADGSAVSGCFAGYCDWPLPTVVELQTILSAAYPCGGTYLDPCIDPAFGPTRYHYWSATTLDADQEDAWLVYFDSGFVGSDAKGEYAFARAVRGGL